MSEESFYEVHTANEDGWTDYHEEDDETEDFQVAVGWLERPDCKWGSVKYKGKTVAWKEDADEPVQFAEGWDAYGKVKGVQ